MTVKRVSDRVEGCLLGQAERAETFFRGQVLVELDVQRASVGIEDALPVGVQFDIPVSDRPHNDARIDQRTAGPLTIDADDLTVVDDRAKIEGDRARSAAAVEHIHVGAQMREEEADLLSGGALREHIGELGVVAVDVRFVPMPAMLQFGWC